MKTARLIVLGSALALTPAVQTPMAQADTLVISSAECARFEKHVPLDDVAYVPGRDARGAAVKPADLDQGGGIEIPEAFEFPLIVELDARLGIPQSTGPVELDAELGSFEYDRGRITFNGKPLQTGAEAAIVAACREHLRKKRRR